MGVQRFLLSHPISLSLFAWSEGTQG
uniref:Uncharacterized protein n=1 Tax=Anguilla anguilla TaxID=7936 RepID=A0A0E9VJ92_ANGAN